MSSWSSGYVSDIGYTYGYYHELNPLRARLALLHAGQLPPDINTACELGFGQGVSVNLHAAATDIRWSGTDFNPSQARFAQELNRNSNAGSMLFDEAFEQFCRRTDLPDFDYIGLHGIWSWISDENRAVIVDFIGKKLKVGGILYVSYNTMPGWASFAPMRHLMTEHADLLGAKGHGISTRIDDAITFAEKLIACNPLFGRANPDIMERLAKMKGQSRHYLAHEYFNRDWDPMHFATMARWLDSAKLQYACSADFADHIDAINLTTDQQNFIKQIPDASFRETVRDFMVNQQFRKDYWVKGARTLNRVEQAELLRQQRIVLAQPAAEVTLEIKGRLGKSGLKESVYKPILSELSDYKPKTIDEIERRLQGAKIGLQQLLQAVLVLTAKGALHPAQDDGASAIASGRTSPLNQRLMRQARFDGGTNYLASPLTGGGIAVPRVPSLFLLARQAGQEDPREWADFAWKILSSQGHKLVKDGKTLETAKENLAELAKQSRSFAETQLPLLKALMIA